MKPNTWNFRVPAVTERKPTADELYLRALKEKHECLVELIRANFSAGGQTISACRGDYDEAIAHYKRLAEDQR